MRNLRVNGKKAVKYMDGYLNATAESVAGFYKKCSLKKLEIEADILSNMARHNRRNDIEAKAYGYRVLWGNCYNFVCGYMLDTFDGETLARYLIIETCSETYRIPLGTAQRSYY